MSKNPVEDVFLTHLGMEFSEFRQISQSIKGELIIHEHYFPNVVSGLCTNLRLYPYTTKFNSLPVSAADKHKRGSGEICGAVISLNYRKVRLFSFHPLSCPCVINTGG